MKRNLKIGRVKTGQALIIFFLVFCLAAGSILAAYHLHMENFNGRCAKVSNTENNDSTYVRKSFPYNRYHNEVLMY